MSVRVKVGSLSLGARFRTLLTRREGWFAGEDQHFSRGVWVGFGDRLQTIHPDVWVEPLPDLEPVSREVHPYLPLRLRQFDALGGGGRE